MNLWEQTSISAYDVADRVKSYDADMEVMHPNRGKMIQIALDIFPAPLDQPLRALDLGVGTGYFAERFLRRYPAAELWALDGAKAMTDLAKARLGPLGERSHFVIGDFRNLALLLPEGASFDLVFSSFALHHLARSDKEDVVRQISERLKDNGWFLNADIVVAESLEIERRIQALRVNGIVQRARGQDPRFVDALVTRSFLDQLEKTDGDQPLTLEEDLEVLRNAGLHGVSVFWFEYREAVCGGIR